MSRCSVRCWPSTSAASPTTRPTGCWAGPARARPGGSAGRPGGPAGASPDAGPGRGDPDDVRGVVGEAGRGPAVGVDERLVLGYVVGHVLGRRAGRVEAGLTLEDDVVAAAAVALQVQ